MNRTSKITTAVVCVKPKNSWQTLGRGKAKTKNAYKNPRKGSKEKRRKNTIRKRSTGHLREKPIGEPIHTDWGRPKKQRASLHPQEKKTRRGEGKGKLLHPTETSSLSRCFGRSYRRRGRDRFKSYNSGTRRKPNESVEKRAGKEVVRMRMGGCEGNSTPPEKKKGGRVRRNHPTVRGGTSIT